MKKDATMGYVEFLGTLSEEELKEYPSVENLFENLIITIISLAPSLSNYKQDEVFELGLKIYEEVNQSTNNLFYVTVEHVALALYKVAQENNMEDTLADLEVFWSKIDPSLLN